MPSFENVAIIGVGLIGGSIGLALRQKNMAKVVTGVGRRQTSLDKALTCGAIDRAVTDLAEGVAEAELVIVATPVAGIVENLASVATACPQAAILTDVGSTKSNICREAATRLGGAFPRFVGSHPLAGDHRTGAENARADLLEGRVVVVTPTEVSAPDAVRQVEQLWLSLGARVMQLSPEDHDQALAVTSHLPHLLASALAEITPQESLPLAATGWADTTRIAAGEPALWTQIFSQNSAPVLEALDTLLAHLEQLRADLAQENWSQLEQHLQQAKRIRDALGN